MMKRKTNHYFKMINVFEPYLFTSDKINVLRSINKKELSGTSEVIGKFETDLANFCDRKYSSAVSNGSVALDLAFKALNLKKDDEVILPSLTIISCLSAVIRSGAKPIFCDVDPNSWNMKLENIENVFTKKTKAILMVHTYGLTAEADEIENFCKEKGIYLIEDAAEAHGQSYNSRACGSFGDISTMSFYANKHITSGEGGAVLTNSNDFNELIKKMRNLDFDNSKRFVHENLYWNYRMGGLQASLARSQINNIDKIITSKIAQGNTYNYLFEDCSDLLQVPLKSTNSSINHYWVYGLVFSKHGYRNELMKRLLTEGIETRPFFWPLHLQKVLTNSEFNNKSLVNSEFLGENGFYIPTGAHMNRKKQEYIAQKIVEIGNSI